MFRKTWSLFKPNTVGITNLSICKRYFSGVYVHVEFPTFIDQNQLDWKQINVEMKKFDGLISKTWLEGIDKNSVGGFYEFDTRQNAENYIQNYLKEVTESQLGVEGTYKIYSKDATKNPSVEMNSPFWMSQTK